MKNKISPVKISLILIVLLTIWVVSGIITPEEEVAEAKEVALPNVRVVNSVAQERLRNVSLRGATQASRMVGLRVEIDGKVEKLLATDGEQMKSGANVLRLDSRGRYENLKRAKAEVAEKKTFYDAAKRLYKKKLQSEVGLSRANSEYEKANSELKEAQLEVNNINIKAPFSGRLQKLQVEVGDYLRAGDLVANFIDTDNFEVVIKVPESTISALKMDDEIDIKLASGDSYKGIVRYISSVANAGTRTYDVEILVNNEAKDTFFDGMTAEAKIPLKKVEAHLISPAYFSLDTDGKIGVKLAERGDVVKFVEVEILEDGADGVWIYGLQKEARIIATGHEYVEEGQKVKISE